MPAAPCAAAGSTRPSAATRRWRRPIPTSADRTPTWASSIARTASSPKSATELEQAVKLNPRQPIYLNQLGITYRQQGQFAKARDAYQRALALDPGYAAAALNLGILYDLYLGDSPRALEQYAPLSRARAGRRRRP